jgi:hypothetical protein
VATSLVYSLSFIVSNSLNSYSFITGRSYRKECAPTDDACRRQRTIESYAAIGCILVTFTVAFYYLPSKGKPAQSNEDYVNLLSNEIDQQDSNQFESGFWSSRYYQYSAWHGPHQFSLLFDPATWKVTGTGLDDVGAYAIEGMYSTKTNRMGLTKTYEKGTGDPTQNLGHNVTIQVAWNLSQRQFEGKWFVKTSKYSGEDKFELKLEKSYRAIE